MNNQVEMMRTFYDMACEKYHDKKYAITVTALNFSVYREKLIQLLGLKD